MDFWAEWCVPLPADRPALEEISNDLQGKVKIAKVNVDEKPQIASQYGIRSIPTLLLFKNGERSIRRSARLPRAISRAGSAPRPRKTRSTKDASGCAIAQPVFVSDAVAGEEDPDGLVDAMAQIAFVFDAAGREEQAREQPRLTQMQEMARGQRRIRRA